MLQKCNAGKVEIGTRAERKTITDAADTADTWDNNRPLCDKDTDGYEVSEVNVKVFRRSWAGNMDDLVGAMKALSTKSGFSVVAYNGKNVKLRVNEVTQTRICQSLGIRPAKLQDFARGIALRPDAKGKFPVEGVTMLLGRGNGASLSGRIRQGNTWLNNSQGRLGNSEAMLLVRPPFMHRSYMNVRGTFRQKCGNSLSPPSQPVPDKQGLGTMCIPPAVVGSARTKCTCVAGARIGIPTHVLPARWPRRPPPVKRVRNSRDRVS
eukprot:g38495.t1